MVVEALVWQLLKLLVMLLQFLQISAEPQQRALVHTFTRILKLQYLTRRLRELLGY